ncbi:hypothetical protein ES703_100163 [subsurface metagenome]
MVDAAGQVGGGDSKIKVTQELPAGLGRIGQEEVVVPVTQHIGYTQLRPAQPAENRVLGYSRLGEIEAVFKPVWTGFDGSFPFVAWERPALGGSGRACNPVLIP